MSINCHWIWFLKAQFSIRHHGFMTLAPRLYFNQRLTVSLVSSESLYRNKFWPILNDFIVMIAQQRYYHNIGNEFTFGICFTRIGSRRYMVWDLKLFRYRKKISRVTYSASWQITGILLPVCKYIIICHTKDLVLAIILFAAFWYGSRRCNDLLSS